MVQKTLASLCCAKTCTEVEKIYLCIRQIVGCVKYLEEAINAECVCVIFLGSTREHFVDRMVWCVNEISDSVKLAANNNESMDVQHNLVYCMDALLDLIAPLTLFNKDSTITMDHHELARQRCLVESLISQTLTFTNLALCDDKNALSAMCQKV